MPDSTDDPERTHFDSPLRSSELYSITFLEKWWPLERAVGQVRSRRMYHWALALQLERTSAAISALSSSAYAYARFQLTIGSRTVV
jgi:hypothetical protein